MRTRLGILLVLCLSVIGLPTPSPGKEATFTVAVPAGQWKTLRLTNLAKNVVLAVEAQSDGDVAVTLVDAAEYARFPTAERPLFSGRVDTELSFSVTTPAAGHYFMVFDNRAGREPRSVKVTVKAVRGTEARTTQDTLRSFERKLNEIFMFDPFSIQMKSCGRPTAFSHQSGIVLCKEYAQKLHTVLGDKAKTADALLFTLFHEVGHILLAQWKYPFFDNEEVADEFATAAMVMFGQKARVLAKAEYFAANPSTAEALAKTFKDDRHPLSVQRARNILRWANDPHLVSKWQTLFIPHMQTALLERLRQQPPSWIDHAMVEKELAGRR